MIDRDQWLLGWGVGYAAVGGASLLVPLYALELGGGPVLIGLLASAAAFAGVPGALLWGWLAGRSNRRRPFLLVALVATAIVLSAMPVVTRPWPLLVLNAALWFVIAAAAPVLNLVMVDGIPEREWEERIGLLNTYQGYGWVAGLGFGTVWTLAVTPQLGTETSLRVLFVVFALAAAAGAAFVYRHYPDPVRLSEAYFRRAYQRLDRGGWGAGRVIRTLPYGTSRIYWGMVSFRPGKLRGVDSPLGRYLAGVTVFSVGFAVFWGPMPAYLDGVGFDDGMLFLLFLVGNLGSAVAYGGVPRVVDRVGAELGQTTALVGRATLFPVVGVVGGLAAGSVLVAICFLLIGVTWAVIAVTTVSLVTRLSTPTQRGEAFGVQAALAGVGTGLGSVAGGALAGSVGYLATFGVAMLVVVAGTALVVTTGRSHSITASLTGST